MPKHTQQNIKRRVAGFFKELNPEKIYTLLEYGIPYREGTMSELRLKNFEDVPPPVFFLSTGRCGTKWFAAHLADDKELKVFHEAVPNFAEAGILAYGKYAEAGGKFTRNDLDWIKELFLAGRERQVRFSYKTGRRYAETNHYLTFFAYALAELFPEAQFVHVVRHPAQFVRSGMRRGWYDKILTQIEPHHKSLAAAWQKYDRIQKLSWLWKETNGFIEDFFDTLPANRKFLFNFNDLSENSVAGLDKFLNLRIRKRKIVKRLSRKENEQRTGSYKSYGEWSAEEKDKLIGICGDLAAKYGYSL